MTERMKWEMPPLPVRDDAEEWESLMSLALDDLLDDADAARLDALMASDAGWSAEWQHWQAMDAELRRAPFVEPPAGFLAGVETKLAQLENRRRLRSGIIVGLAAVLLWGSGLVGLLSLGAFVLANQAVWLNQLIHTLALGWVWLSGMAQLLWSGVINVAASPQAMALGVCYAMLAAVLLAGWIRLLRKTTRDSDALTA
jgi:anti-sigma factor RsiW